MRYLDFSQLENYPSQILAQAFREASDAEADRLVEILTGRGDEPVPYLIEALQDSENVVRYYAVYTLKLIGDRRAIVPISNLLTDKDDNVRVLAALYLPSFGNIVLDRYTPYLISTDWKMRSSAAIMLGQSPDDRAIELLLPLLRDENQRVRFDAMWALGKLVIPALSLPDKEKVLPVLVEATHNSDIDTRATAAEILGNLRDSRAVEILTGLRENDPEVYVREAAAKALQNLAS